MRLPWKREGKEDSVHTVLLGTELAAAAEAEERHRAVPRGRSPIAGLRYEPVRRELDLFRFVESPTDEVIHSVVEETWALPAGSFADVRDALTQDDFYTLLAFSRRRVLSALRQGSAAAASAGFRALALVDVERIDWRDAVVAAELLAYAGRRVGLQVQDVISEIAQRAEPAITEILSSRSEGIGTAGYREIRTSQGVGLADDDGHPYAPTVDLVAIAEKVMAFMEHDEYRADDITTGTDLPMVWLPAGNTTTTRAVERLRGCLSVDARPRNDLRGMPDQMFTVWIAEAAKPRDAQAIASAAVPSAGSDTAIMGVASGDLCSVLVARSVVEGVPAVEDMTSVERFRASLQAAITPE